MGIAQDGQCIERNHVYVTPPGATLTVEEVYSLAMLVREQLEQHADAPKVQIAAAAQRGHKIIARQGGTSRDSWTTCWT